MDTYKTTNLSLAAWFACKSHMPDTIEISGQMRSRPSSNIYMFIYEGKFDVLKELEADYFKSNAEADLKTYEYHKKALKEMVDNQQTMNGV